MPGSSSQHQDRIVLGITQIHSKALSTVTELFMLSCTAKQRAIAFRAWARCQQFMFQYV